MGCAGEDVLLSQWANYAAARLVSVLINNTLPWAGQPGGPVRGCYCRLWGAHSPRSPGTSPGGLTPPRAGNPALVSMVVMPCAGTRGGCPAGHLDGGGAR